MDQALMSFFSTKKAVVPIEQRVHQAYDDHRNFYAAEHNFMLFKIQKVASTSLWTAMAALMGHGTIKSREQLLGLQLPALPGHQLDLYPEIFKAGFVRNPWDRLLSCYLQKKKYNRYKFYQRNQLDPNGSFGEFVEAVCRIPEWKADKHFRSQYTFVTSFEGSFLTDFIGHFEHLEEDFERLSQQAQLPKLHLPHWNKTEHDSYTQYYSPALADKVAQRYAIDLALFGYEFGKELTEEARNRWQRPIPTALQLKIAQYKSKKLLHAIEQVSQYVSPYKE
ncbi:MAG: sulfotransferase family 2 domain-containing protein [Bacteroidota bacterium]